MCVWLTQTQMMTRTESSCELLGFPFFNWISHLFINDESKTWFTQVGDGCCNCWLVVCSSVGLWDFPPFQFRQIESRVDTLTHPHSKIAACSGRPRVFVLDWIAYVQIKKTGFTFCCWFPTVELKRREKNADCTTTKPPRGLKPRAPCQLTHWADSEKTWRAFDSSLSNSSKKSNRQQLRGKFFLSSHSLCSTAGLGWAGAGQFSSLSLLSLSWLFDLPGPKRRRSSQLRKTSRRLFPLHTPFGRQRNASQRRDVICPPKSKNTFNFLHYYLPIHMDGMMDSVSSLLFLMSTLKTTIHSSFIDLQVVPSSIDAGFPIAKQQLALPWLSDLLSPFSFL